MTIITQIKKMLLKSKKQFPVGVIISDDKITLYSKMNDKSLAEVVELGGQSVGAALRNKFDELSVDGEIYLILSNDKNKLIQVEKPNVPDEEVNSALKWQIKDLVNVPPEKMLLDYFDGPTFSGVKKVNVVCVSKSEVSEIVNDLYAHDLKIKVITTEEFAFSSLLPIKNHATLMVCQQPNEEINILIIKEGQVYFTRRLRGFSTIGEKTQDELMLGLIDSLSLEIQRSTDYFERQLKQPPIKNIQILLPIALESFIAEKLAENTNVQVELLSLPDFASDLRDFSIVIGATQLNYIGLKSNG